MRKTEDIAQEPANNDSPQEMSSGKEVKKWAWLVKPFRNCLVWKVLPEIFKESKIEHEFYMSSETKNELFCYYFHLNPMHAIIHNSEWRNHNFILFFAEGDEQKTFFFVSLSTSHFSFHLFICLFSVVECAHLTLPWLHNDDNVNRILLLQLRYKTISFTSCYAIHSHKIAFVCRLHVLSFFILLPFLVKVYFVCVFLFVWFCFAINFTIHFWLYLPSIYPFNLHFDNVCFWLAAFLHWT